MRINIRLLQELRISRMKPAVGANKADWLSGLTSCGWHIVDKERFFSEMITALRQLDTSPRRISLILIPHDTRTDRWSDLDTLTEFRERLTGIVTVIGSPQDIRSGIDAKQVVRYCDVVLTGRMHLAIAAFEQGVTPVSFCYQGKFEGLYQLFAMGSEWMVSVWQPP